MSARTAACGSYGTVRCSPLVGELEDKPRALLEPFLEAGEELLYARSIWGEWADLRLHEPLLGTAASLYAVGITSGRVIAAPQKILGRARKLKLDLDRDQALVRPGSISVVQGRGYKGEKIGLFVPLDGRGERALFLMTAPFEVRDGAEQPTREALEELAVLLSDRIESSRTDGGQESAPPAPSSGTSTPIEEESAERLSDFLEPDERLVYARSVRANKGLLIDGGPLVRGKPRSLAIGLSERRLIAAPLGPLRRAKLVVDRRLTEVSLTSARVSFGSDLEGEGYVLGTCETSGPYEVIYWLRFATLVESEWEHDETSDAVEELARRVGTP